MNLTFLCLVIAVLAMPIKAWMEGDGGQVRWDNSCYWTGGDIDSFTSKPDHCGGACLGTPGCTRFNWNADICYVKGSGGELVTGQGNLKIYYVIYFIY